MIGDVLAKKYSQYSSPLASSMVAYLRVQVSTAVVSVCEHVPHVNEVCHRGVQVGTAAVSVCEHAPHVNEVCHKVLWSDNDTRLCVCARC